MKVQWRVAAVFCAAVFVGWIAAAEEADRRKLIIHVPRVHRGVHKHVPRHAHKASGHHGKGHERPSDHVHKHHHHFHDEEYGEGSHGHGYEDHGHHRGRKYRRNPHHHHSGYHSHPGHHYDHHGHDSHHVEHHRHPDHHDDDFHSRYRTEESRYHYDHYPDHSHHHHRPHRYEDDEEYDCMEVCEKCKMKSYHRKHIMGAENEGLASRPHPQLTVAKFKPTSSPPTPSSYMTRVKDEFKPSLATGELSEAPSGYDESKYAGYILPTAMEHAARPGKVNSISGHLQNEDIADDYAAPFPNFQSANFMPSGSWQNSSYYYGEYKDPLEKVVEYNVQRGQLKHTRYGEEETRQGNGKNNDERGRDLRYLNRYKYIKR